MALYRSSLKCCDAHFFHSYPEDVHRALDRLEKTVRVVDPNDQSDDIVEDSTSVESRGRGRSSY